MLAPDRSTDHGHVPLEARRRLSLLPRHLGFKITDVFRAEVVHEGAMRPVFDGSYEFAQKLFNRNRRHPRFDDDRQRLVNAWLCAKFGEDVHADLFSFACTTEEQFLASVRVPSPWRPRKTTTRYGSRVLDDMAQVVAQAEALDDPDAYRVVPGRTSVGARTAAVLADLVAEAGVPPPPALFSRLADVVDMCGGCGRGSERHDAYRPVLETTWERGRLDLARLSSEDELVGLADVGARLSQGARLEGRPGAAREFADGVVDLLERVRPTHRSVGVMGRVRDSLRPEGVGGGRAPDGLDVMERAFGRWSREYVGELKCAACRAVACRSPAAEEILHVAEDAIRKARDRNPREREGLAWDALDVDFLRLVLVTGDAEAEPRRAAERLRRAGGVDYLRGLWDRTRSPLRKAFVAHALIVVGARSREAVRRKALALLEERPLVRALCVLDVDRLRRRLLRGGRPVAGSA